MTPSEEDGDELRECIAEGSWETDAGGSAIDVGDGWIEAMISRGLVRNWRELANDDSTTLHSILSGSTDLDVAPTDGNTTVSTEAKTMTTAMTGDIPSITSSIEAIDTWIDAAQSRTIEEVIALYAHR